MDDTEFLYRLLYHRRHREAFLQGQGPKPAAFREVDAEQLEQAARKIVLQMQALLKGHCPGTWQAWGALFPQDQEGFELTYLFLESSHFEQVHNLAIGPSSLAPIGAFRDFLEERLPPTPKFAHLKRELGRDMRSL